MDINPATRLCAFVAHPAHHTGSPAMHNAGYNSLGLDYVYLAFDVLDIGKAIESMRALGIVGYSVSLPHKVEVMKFLDEIEPVAKEIGAVNTVVNKNGKIKGYNSDWEGSVKSIKEQTQISGKNVVLVGAGGAGRAIAFGIKKEKGVLSVIDQNLEKAQALASETQAKAYDLGELKSILEKADILIHATPVGMSPNINESVISKEFLHKNLVVNDIVYTPKETKLIKEAENVGCKIVFGYKMLLLQAVTQFELFTGHTAPVNAMEQALLKFLLHK